MTMRMMLLKQNDRDNDQGCVDEDESFDAGNDENAMVSVGASALYLYSS